MRTKHPNFILRYRVRFPVEQARDICFGTMTKTAVLNEHDDSDRRTQMATQTCTRAVEENDQDRTCGKYRAIPLTI